LDAFSLFSRSVREALKDRGFESPTEPQEKAIPMIFEGKNVLLVAPTGTGKTEAAFLPILQRLLEERGPWIKAPGIKVLYITPLRALNRDLLERLEWWCKRFDFKLAVRHGDTPHSERMKQTIAPPDVLITTPETFQAILPTKRMRMHLRHVRWVIVDEVHELATDKRGAQLSLGLERLRLVTGRDFQLIGLSATVGSPEEVARFLVGTEGRCEVVVVPVERLIRVDIAYPQPEPPDYALASQLSLFPEVAARLRLIRELIEGHTSTLVFTNTRIENEVLGSRFRVWDDSFPIAVHHGSLSRPSRMKAERELKDGLLKGLISTSSLEMGIDIGRLDLVIQYNSPRQVTRLVQRVGRSGHRIGLVAKGVVVTQDSDDFWEAAVIARRAITALLEDTEVIQKPLDVLAHQLAGLLLEAPRWGLEEALRLARKAYPYWDLTEEELLMVAKYMVERRPRFARLAEGELRRPPRIKALFKYYFDNLSMIPEERHYVVYDEGGEPVGILDESFIAEYGEIGLKFVLRGSIWRIESISEGVVRVRSERDPTGAVPFWVGEEIPVPLEIAQEVGRIRGFVEEVGDFERVVEELSKRYPVSPEECRRGLREIREQIELGIPLPTHKRVTIEKWHELLIVQTCWGHLVNRAIGRVISYILSNRFGYPVGLQVDPYRIVLRAPWVSQEEVAEVLMELTMLDFEEILRRAVGGTGSFKRHFVNAAKKFGVIEKGAALTDVSIRKLIEGLRGTAVEEEAYRSTMRSDADIKGSKRVLRMLARGEVSLEIVGDEVLTPTARVGIEELSRRTEIVPPERLRHIILQAVRARLMGEALTFTCASCWSYLETLRVKQVLGGLTCPVCGSRRVGFSREDEEKVRRLAVRMRASGRPPAGLRALHRRIAETAELFEERGGVVAFILAERMLRVSDAVSLLREHREVSDELVWRIVETVKEKMRRGLT